MTANTGRKQGSRFKPGQSGNPAGKPVGTRHRATLAAETLLDGEADALTRKAVEMAKAGDTVAMRLCLERILPPRRDRPVRFALPAMEAPADVVKAASALAHAVAAGDLTPGEAADLSKVISGVGQAIELNEIDARLRKLEEAAEAKR